ncbi:MAG: aminodeoxychorismate/anthranilate synthase component II [Thermoanaerobaculia bacterium]|nr:aminodeoxychorismate/anthranilate synthase component II [Thermoanaerobaculia bacterium]
MSTEILVVDNYDSFTYNLVQQLTMQGAEVTVLRNDAESATAMLARSVAGIVLSPGPGRPEGAGVCLELLERRPTVPVLGVCLGHQCLGVSYGATVDRARRLMHGKTSRIRHGGVGLFAGLSNPFRATRYHSLDVVEETLSEPLEPMAWSEEGSLMAMRHRERPYWGVQFHPESVLTDEGDALMANFLRLCRGATVPAAGESSEGGAVHGNRGRRSR